MTKPPFLPVRTLLIAAAASAAAALPSWYLYFEWRRDAILGGEIWRLFTGHFVHATTYHLLWDGIPLLALGFLFEEYLGKRFWMVLGISCLAVGGGLLILEPDLGSYCGLSGVLNGIWVAGALAAAAKEKQTGRIGLSYLYLACVFLDIGKIGFELFTGSQIFTDIQALGGTPVPWAHALGVLGGVFFHVGGKGGLSHWNLRPGFPGGTKRREYWAGGGLAG